MGGLCGRSAFFRRLSAAILHHLASSRGLDWTYPASRQEIAHHVSHRRPASQFFPFQQALSLALAAVAVQPVE
jgi:hypothetical protein